MGFIKFNGVKISGISVCVPTNVVDNKVFGETLLDELELVKTIDTIGVYQRHVVSKEICASDLCFEAASELIQKHSVEKNEIEAVIFVSQTPDYHLPATACIIQNKLGLNKKTMAFDVNLGCSGYVYGLSLSFSLIGNMPHGSKILLLVGDTISKCVSNLDRSSAFLFGDAGSATLIEADSESNHVFCSLNSDGAGYKSLIIEGGGYRNPSSEQTLIVSEGVDKNLRSQENLYMDGAEIFNFTIREIPKDILGLIDYANERLDKIDYFFFHQANKFMVDFLARKVKIPQNKYPLSLAKYGNTSSASIPLTMATMREALNPGPAKIILAGFGVGLSWGTMLLDLNKCSILPIKNI